MGVLRHRVVDTYLPIEPILDFSNKVTVSEFFHRLYDPRNSAYSYTSSE